jgi:broad specificity phosphatase PhoE
MRLLLIRHGESIANAEGRLQGHLDIPLSDRGRRQAELLAATLEPLGVAALYASPLLRAKGTAEIIGAQLGLAIEERAALIERNWGEAEGLTSDEIIARFPQYLPQRREVRHVEIPGFEQDGELTQRAMQGLRAIIDAHADGAVAIVTHGGVIVTYCKETLRIPAIRPWPFAVDNASITTFDIVRGDRPRSTLLTLNDTCHLNGV